MSIYRPPNSMPVLQRRNSADKEIFKPDVELYNEGIKYLSNFSRDGFNQLFLNGSLLFNSRKLTDTKEYLDNLQNRFNIRIKTRRSFDNFSEEEFKAIRTKLKNLAYCFATIESSRSKMVSFNYSILQSIGISQKQDKTKTSRTIRKRRPKSPDTLRDERKAKRDERKRKRREDRQNIEDIEDIEDIEEPPLSPTKMQKINIQNY